MNLKKIFLTTLTLTCLLSNIAGPARLQAAEKTTDVPAEKVHITSDSMMFDEMNSQVEFTGNVVATRLDATIHADHVIVLLYSEAEKKIRAVKVDAQAPDDNVKQLIATGNVKVIQKDATATADKAVYNTTKKTIVLTGKSPTVLSGKNYVTGKTITLFQDTRRVVVEGGENRRVEAFFDSNTPKPGTN
ncbi:MAG: LptA/OstA family protein [Desulfobacterium sp.]